MSPSGTSNRAVVVSVGRFDPGVELSNRPGAPRDTKRLHGCLSRRGFSVELHNDLTSEEIYKLFRTESRRPVDSCFLTVLSSHGDQGCVFGADGKVVLLSKIFGFFDNETMEDKTKVFLIQACQGEAMDDGVQTDSNTFSSFSQHLSVPVDSAVMYAAVPGYAAFMNPTGSFFLQTFCDLLEDHAHMELTRLMTRLSQRVALRFSARGRFSGKKQMPCLTTRLTREVFPFAAPRKVGGDTGVTATALVSSERERSRTRSIS
ncbi:caspase-7 [Gouania willdenowi]|uniref:Caspase-7-like n=1 Tax=Gouania willdenowi TaxID=441366 RepID=A0A8C5G4C3_GOUWI|nr:caspase-7-like [Gouania willdenowi]